MTTFEVPDALATAPPATFEFHPDAAAGADILLTTDPGTLYRRLLRDQESETVLMAARRIIHGFLSRPGERAGRPPADPEAIAERVDQFHEVIAALLADLSRITRPAREAVLRQRAPLALLGGCWLDVVSQPATQPSATVHRLLEHQFVLRGEGDPRRGLHHQRRLALEEAGVYLPETAATDFPRITEIRPLTAMHGAFYLSLAKLPANFLPEVVGVHYAVSALGVDDRFLGTRPTVTGPELRTMLGDYLAAAPELGERVVDAVELALTLELEHVSMLAHLAAWRDGRLRAAAPNAVGDIMAAAWLRAISVAPPCDVVLRPADAPDDRRFLHRLVNIENHPNTRSMAREHAAVVLGIAEEALFERGDLGTTTDASWFDYTPEALRERVDRIRRIKGRLGGPVAVAMAGLTSGACTHRIGTVGRYTTSSDGALYSRHVNEMGVGGHGTNQVAEAYRLLGALGVRVPHIGTTAFLDENVAPDFPCELAIHQLCLSLFPDTFYPEILGFQLGIVTSGLGNAPEEAIEEATEAVVAYLDDVGSTGGSDTVRARWRRIWRGYASFAYLVEPEPVGAVVVDVSAEQAVREQPTIYVRR